MYSRVIPTKTDGNFVYANTGSSAKLQSYLNKENTEVAHDVFFNAEGDFSKATTIESLDHNVKGLGVNDEKFYPLIISPSPAELAHIGNDDEKLKAFTISCMENYAENFNIKTKSSGTQRIQQERLVWYATIHHSREYKGDDPQVLSGEKKQGQLKEGLNTHIRRR